MGQSSGKAKPPQMDSQQARKAPSCPSLAPVTDLVEGGGEGLLASATGMARALVMGRPGLPRDSHVASTGSAHTAHSFHCQQVGEPCMLPGPCGQCSEHSCLSSKGPECGRATVCYHLSSWGTDCGDLQ